MEIFDKMAKQYDTDERIKIAKIISDTMRTHVINGKEKKALDYGCGTGLVGLSLIDEFKSILFVDTSPQMLEQVRQKIERNNIHTASTLCYDFIAELPDGLYVDYILMSQVLLHIKDVESILKNLYKLLNKDGHLLIVDFDKNNNIISDKVHNGFEVTNLINLLKKIGFTKANSKTFYEGKKIFMNKDASMFILNAQK